MEAIDTMRVAHPELADKLGVVAELHAKKLWHQLTLALLELVKDPAAQQGDLLIQLYQRFISGFEGRLSQLHFVLLLDAVAARYCPSRPFAVPELERAVSFLAGFRDKGERLGAAALLVLNMQVAVLQVRQAGALAAAGDAAAATALLDGVKAALRSGEAALDALREGEDPAVPAAYHRACAEYYKLRGPAASFYSSALLFLGCTQLEALPPPERHALAVDVALAALVGEGVYNFGEVAGQPLLGALEGTPQAWLKALLSAFQRGDIDGFNALVAANRAAFDAQPALVAASAVLKEKITLLRVMELAASRPAGNRSLSFAELAAETRLPVDQVEWLAMRAMSLGLIKGSLDQVDQVLNVSFVKPRVLSREQIAALQEAVGTWGAKTEAALVFMETRTQELFK